MIKRAGVESARGLKFVVCPEAHVRDDSKHPLQSPSPNFKEYFPLLNENFFTHVRPTKEVACRVGHDHDDQYQGN